MTRYHVNRAGDPGVCRAKTKCPFGDMEADHYDSVPEARAAFETKMRSESSLSSVSRASNWEKTGDVKIPRGIKVLGKHVPTVRDGVEHIRAEYAKVEYAQEVTPEMVAQQKGGIIASGVQDHYFEPVRGEMYLVIESYETDPIDGVSPDDVEDDDEDRYWSGEPVVYKSLYKLDDQTVTEINDFAVKQGLENIVETSYRKDLPMWAALPATQGIKHPTSPSSLDSSNPEKAARKVEAMENRIRALGNNMARDAARGEKLAEVEADLVTLSEAFETESRPAVKTAIASYRTELEVALPKLRRQIKRADPTALSKELRALKREAAVANSAYAKVREQDFREGLASHYPSTDPEVRAKAADDWIRDNPAVVESGWNYSF